MKGRRAKAMKTLLVTYTGNASDRFDRDYYVNKHLPLAREIGGPLGMLSIEAFFPSGNTSGIVASCMIVLRDKEAEHALFSSPRFEELVKDLPNFSNLTPEQSFVPHLTD
jgi:uncharacterized protein (TIGR02118 family)